MLSGLSERLQGALGSIRGRSKLTEKDIDAALKEVRMALLEADVNFKVAKEFCARVKEQSLGEEILKSLTPDQQVVKIVHEELKGIMGGGAEDLALNQAPPVVILLVGLQGSGKTTSCGKLARYLRKELKRNPFLVPADVYRPAAIEQLKTLGKQLDIEVFNSTTNDAPEDIAVRALEEAKGKGYDTVIIDTAGRLQIDGELMQELAEIEERVEPAEILLVADAMTGQEAVNVANGFSEKLDLTGLILTKFDGDARGGAALSMKSVTGKPIKFIGVGEKLDAFEVFHPDRVASRILGMGDMLGLIEKAVAQVDLEESKALQKKIKKNEFTLEDFLGQMAMVKKMGSISSLAGMIPGMDKMMKKVDEADADKEMKRIEAIILSMTPKERQNHQLINGSRRRRIAAGSGTSVQQVNQLIKQFVEMRKMMKQFSKMGAGGLMNMLGGKGGMGSLMKQFGK